jgi:manganese/zinc/iron transport system permease protein
MGSITDTSVRWPAWTEWLQVITLADYNTRVVVIGVTLLGLASGVIGSFMLLRKRSLLGDALSHATLPGIAIAFMVMTALGYEGKSLPGLLLGATISGVLGVACVLLLVRHGRLKEDAALGIVLSVFFGLGIAALGLVQKMTTGSAAGLTSFIYGKTASMVAADAWLIAIVAGVIAVVCILLFKEFALLCFDQDYAGTQGWPTTALDIVMMALVVAVTVVGLQAVGLILMIALLIIPPAAARFWTHHLPTLVAAAAVIGAISCLLGAGISALVPRMPAGAIIVIVAGAVFLVSMVCGPVGGVVIRAVMHRRLTHKVAAQHLLRAMYELTEGESDRPVALTALADARSWSSAQLGRAIRTAEHDGLVIHADADPALRLTDPGRREAWRMTRNHRLWELYLINYADIAPSHVDRDADQVEHVLHPDVVTELESLLLNDYPNLSTPPSPHVLTGAAP